MIDKLTKINKRQILTSCLDNCELFLETNYIISYTGVA